MTITKLDLLLNQHQAPVILLEDMDYDTSTEDRDSATQLTAWLANRYPHAIFRISLPTSTRFDGSKSIERDVHYAAAVLQANPARLQIVDFYGNKISFPNLPESSYHDLCKIAKDENAELALRVIEALPLDLRYLPNGHCPRYPSDHTLIRETIHIIGSSNHRLQKITLSISNSADPSENTLSEPFRTNLSRQNDIPNVEPDTWKSWLNQ